MAGENDKDLGPCCVCEGITGVRNMVMLDKKSPIPGKGWGCFLCGLKMDGAVAVVCDGCIKDLNNGHIKVRFACRGYPGVDGRVPIESLQGVHHHNMALHEADYCRRFGVSQN